MGGSARGMLCKLRDDNTVTIKVRRGIETTLFLDRKSVSDDDGHLLSGFQPLGIEWPEDPQGSGLVVRAVNEGLFADWNESQTENPTAMVRVGDRIIRVDNTTDGAVTISKAIQEVSHKFQLSLVRPAPESFDGDGKSKDGFSNWRFSR